MSAVVAFGGVANDDLRPGPASLGAAAKPAQRAMLPGAPSPQPTPCPGDLRQALEAINCTAGLRTSVAEVRSDADSLQTVIALTRP
jgi:hypothetical protein